MQKVCILTTAHSPFDDRIYHREAVSLARIGYDVSIIAPWNISELTSEGIQIIAVKKTTTHLERFSITAARVFKAAMSRHADIYHFHDPDLLPWMLLFSILGKYVIYDVHEYNSKSILEKSWLPAILRKPLAMGVEWLEGFASAMFSGVITVNQHMADIFYQFNKMVQPIANYPTPWFMDSCNSLVDATPERIIYVGGLNKKRGYELIFDAMQLVRKRRPNATCLIIGSIDISWVDESYPKFNETCKAIDGVIWGGTVALSEIPMHLLSSQVCWIPFEDSWRFAHTEPIKLFEYMAACRPVVASKLSFITKIVEKTECGLLASPSDPEAHADAICYLLDHPDIANQMGKRGRKAVLERYNWSYEEKKLLSFYEEIISG